MLSKDKIVESQKECADMLGMNLKDYEDYLKNAKANDNPKKFLVSENEEDIFKYLGIKESQLKKRKEEDQYQKKSIVGEIWLVAIPLLVTNKDNSFDTTFQIRPFLMIDDGKGVLVEENKDFLGVKITNNDLKQTRLITYVDLEDLGYECREVEMNGNIKNRFIKTEVVPTWIWNSNYSYWTMEADYSDMVDVLKIDGEVSSYNGGGRQCVDETSYVVRPVVELYKNDGITRKNQC